MLEFNDEKTTMTIFIYIKNHLETYGGCSLTIGDDTVSPSDRRRNLGVHMDLNMTDHVTGQGPRSRIKCEERRKELREKHNVTQQSPCVISFHVI